MKKITNRTLKKITAGTRLYDTIANKYVIVNAIEYGWYIIDLLMEDSESVKKNYILY